MTLEPRPNSGGGTKHMLVECPASDCSESWTIGDNESRAAHFRNKHEPEDFGLTGGSDEC
jgi:hypothetical protein